MSNTPQNHTSLGFFNQVRGLGILWIILGHSMALFITAQGSSAAMPVFLGAGRVVGGGVLAMFFMISGFYFYRRSPVKCIKTQARVLLKPYFLTGLAILAVKGLIALINGYAYVEYAVGMTLTWLLGINVLDGRTIAGIPLKTVSIFWFVLALFGGWVLYNLILGLKNKQLQRVCIPGSIVLSWILTEISNVWVAALPMALLAVGYIAAGHAIREYHLLERKLPKTAWTVIGLLALVSLAFGNVDIAASVWKLGLVDMAGSFCVGFLMLRAYNRLARRGYNGRFIKWMEQIGLSSIWFFCLHAFEKEVVNWNGLNRVFPGHPVLCTAVCFVCRCILIYLLYVLIFLIRKILRSKQRPIITITQES